MRQVPIDGPPSVASSPLPRERGALDAIFGALADGVLLQDAAGIVYANAAALRGLGLASLDELLALGGAGLVQRWDITDESGASVDLVAGPTRLAGGSAERVLRLRGRASGDERWARVIESPIRGASGDAAQAVTILQDVTGERRAREHERLLADAGALLASSLDVGETLTAFGRMLVPTLADWCAIDLLEPGGSIRSAVLAIADARLADAVRGDQAQRRARLDDVTGLATVARTRQPLTIPKVQHGSHEATLSHAASPALIRATELRSCMIVPILVRGEAAGALTLLTSGERARSFDASDLALARALTERVALALEHARLYREAQESRERLADFQRGVPIALFATTPDGRFLEANDAFARMLGYGDLSTFMSVPVGSLYAEPAQRAEIMALINRDGSAQGRIVDFLRRDGARVSVSISARVIRDANGLPVRYEGALEDVTERIVAQRELATQKTLLEAQMESVLDGILLVAIDGRILGHNRRFADIWGIPDEVLRTRDVAEARRIAIERVRDPQTFLLGTRYYEDRAAEVCRDEVAMKDGRVFDRYGAPVRAADGRLIGRIWSYRDITDRKLSEQRTRDLLAENSAQRTRLDAIIRSVPGVVWEAWGRPDAVTQRIDYVSPYVERMLGYSVQEWTSTPNFWRIILHPEDEERAVAESARIFRSGAQGTLEFRWITKDGRARWIQAFTVAIRDGDGSPIGTRGVALDVTERKIAEEDLRLKAAQLERSNQELDQFAYVTSHDLKAPLRGIANLSRWIEEDLGDAERADARAHLDLLRGRVHRMESLIDAILEYSRVGRVRARIERVDVGAMLAEAVDLLAPPEGFRVEIEGAMPQVDAERARLQQVFMNLVSNAIKHHHDKPHGLVTISHRDAGAFHEFTVADNGPGIPKRYHPKMFVIFQTLEARDKVEGTGIGLALVKKIVESYGGTVKLDSDEGLGAAFTFTWPKRPAKSVQIIEVESP